MLNRFFSWSTCYQCGITHPELMPEFDGFDFYDICPLCCEMTRHSLHPEPEMDEPSSRQRLFLTND